MQFSLTKRANEIARDTTVKLSVYAFYTVCSHAAGKLKLFCAAGRMLQELRQCGDASLTRRNAKATVKPW